MKRLLPQRPAIQRGRTVVEILLDTPGLTSIRRMLLMKWRTFGGLHASSKANRCLCGQGKPHQ